MKANWLICFALVVSTIHVIQCKSRSSGGRHGSSRGTHTSHGSSGGSSRGSSSSGHISVKSPPFRKSPVPDGSGGTHGYPPSPGLSGSGKQQAPEPTSHGTSGGSSRGSSLGSGYAPDGGGYSGSGKQPWGTVHHAPSYYSSPQHVYVTQYRNSGSRYDNILTGLTMYNLGRSHSHHHHNYHDSYYKDSTASRTESGYLEHTNEDPNEEATCFLKMWKNRQEEVVKVPCAIVSTFIENNVTSDMNQNNVTSVSNCSSVGNVLLNRLDENNTLNDNDNCVNCTRRVEDPLVVKGKPIDTENMECLVEIRTNENIIQNTVDCEILSKYAKMPVPEQKVNAVMPRRETLKAMVYIPPWWLSLFIAA